MRTVSVGALIGVAIRSLNPYARIRDDDATESRTASEPLQFPRISITFNKGSLTQKVIEEKLSSIVFNDVPWYSHYRHVMLNFDAKNLDPEARPYLVELTQLAAEHGCTLVTPCQLPPKMAYLSAGSVLGEPVPVEEVRKPRRNRKRKPAPAQGAVTDEAKAG